ncbi:hypothetical protein PILCRDRAFT_817337 [Piloderma croceum F 1598]|uniref:Uncharacterized protein n=1 Tax=Piloderma croceum (strain F 1598) TaxID=765440 RepID=A0A0C3C6N8_PILCF|nr:hypothetical protein PILCRDRAFT_817337 [Piloderma croceum F 1598]
MHTSKHLLTVVWACCWFLCIHGIHRANKLTGECQGLRFRPMLMMAGKVSRTEYMY